MSRWGDKFSGTAGEDTSSGGAVSPDEVENELTPAPDPATYQPWILQRGRGRPAMFIDLRRFEPKTGTMSGSQISYPHLVAVEYTGDTMVSLDFGTRHFVIRGEGLYELVQRLQMGSVLALQEYSARVWPTKPAGPIITAIEKIGI